MNNTTAVLNVCNISASENVIKFRVIHFSEDWTEIKVLTSSSWVSQPLNPPPMSRIFMLKPISSWNNQNTDVWSQNTQLQQVKRAEFNKVITYSHIKDTAGIRHGVTIHLAFLTGAGDVEPVQGSVLVMTAHLFYWTDHQVLAWDRSSQQVWCSMHLFPGLTWLQPPAHPAPWPSPGGACRPWGSSQRSLPCHRPGKLLL